LELHCFEEIYQLLTRKQRQFRILLQSRSKKSKWLEVLALKKGITVAEDMDTKQNNWKIMDGGCGKRLFRCKCGIATSVSEGIRDIKKGFCTIHLEIIINAQEMMEFCL
jgi:hypothetical protein